MPLRVAIDANVLIAGIGWPRWPYEVLRHAEQGDFRLVLSPFVMVEARRRIARHLPERVAAFEFYLHSVEYELAPLPSRADIAAHQDLVRQREDIPIALSIQAANVDYFVTADRDFTAPGKTTAQVRQAISHIMLPAVFLRTVMGWTSEELEAIRHRTWSDLKEVS